MRQFFASSKLLFLDMASTFLFLAVFLLTGSIPLSVALGMALGVAQVSWEFARGKPIAVMQWMSLFLGSGLIDHSQNMTAAAIQIAEK